MKSTTYINTKGPWRTLAAGVLGLALAGCATTAEQTQARARTEASSEPVAQGGAVAPGSWKDLSQPLTEPPARAGDALLSEAQLTKERALVRYALDRGYGGRRAVPEREWAELLRRVEMLDVSPRTVASWCEALGDVLWAVTDQHLSIGLRGPAGTHHCGAGRPGRRMPAVGPNLAGSVRPYLARRVSLAGAPVLELAVTAFPPAGAPDWAGYDEALAVLPTVRAVLVDLRGNDGGDDARGFQLAERLVDGPVDTHVVRVERRQTPETLTLLLNTVDRMGRAEDGGLAPHLDELYQRLDAWRARVLASPGEEYEVEEVTQRPTVLGPKHFGGPVAVLVDAGCASSCESTLEVLRRFPGARVFGESTAGFVHFGDVGSLTLPESGLRLHVPTKAERYEGGVSYERVGFPPDEVVSAGRDAVEAARAWLATELRRRTSGKTMR